MSLLKSPNVRFPFSPVIAKLSKLAQAAATTKESMIGDEAMDKLGSAALPAVVVDWLTKANPDESKFDSAM